MGEEKNNTTGQDYTTEVCCCSGVEVGRIETITTDATIIRWIGTTLITGVGSAVSITKVREGGIFWRQLGKMMDASMGSRWLVEN